MSEREPTRYELSERVKELERTIERLKSPKAILQDSESRALFGCGPILIDAITAERLVRAALAMKLRPHMPEGETYSGEAMHYGAVDETEQVTDLPIVLRMRGGTGAPLVLADECPELVIDRLRRLVEMEMGHEDWRTK